MDEIQFFSYFRLEKWMRYKTKMKNHDHVRFKLTFSGLIVQMDNPQPT